MAKKVDTQPQKVRCSSCFWGGDKVENFLTDCHNKQANPGGYKMGTYERICNQFNNKDNGNRSQV